MAKTKLKNKKITLVGIVYKKNEKQVNRMIDSFIKVENRADWLILYDKEDQTITNFNFFNKYKNHFHESYGIRTKRVLDNSYLINTEYVFIIDGDDFIETETFLNLCSDLKSGYDMIYLNNHSFCYVEGKECYGNFYHGSMNYVSNVIYSKRILNTNLFNESIRSFDQWEDLEIGIYLNEFMLGMSLLKYSKRILLSNKKSPYIRELNSETSYLHDPNMRSNKMDIEIYRNYKEKNFCKIPLYWIDIKKGEREKSIIVKNAINTYEKLYGSKSKYLEKNLRKKDMEKINSPYGLLISIIMKYNVEVYFKGGIEKIADFEVKNNSFIVKYNDNSKEIFKVNKKIGDYIFSNSIRNEKINERKLLIKKTIYTLKNLQGRQH